MDDEEHSLNPSSSWEVYSKPVVFLDVMWNLSFVVVSCVVLILSVHENPSTPLRLWLSGYALQCLLHVGILCFQYNRTDMAPFAVTDLLLSQSRLVVKRLESMNTIIGSLWWVLGFYWIVVGGQSLLLDSPRLYWLTVIFLAFDVFFIIFCIVMACSFFLAFFCFIPIIAIAYAIATRKGASEDDIRSLPKYRYRFASSLSSKNSVEKQNSVNSTIDELTLHPDYSDCCICLSPYIDGVELYRLPCDHHFHCGCISKWLRINATCPLCKFNICQGDSLV